MAVGVYIVHTYVRTCNLECAYMLCAVTHVCVCLTMDGWDCL